MDQDKRLKLQDELAKFAVDSVGGKKERSLEQALQEALDNTTPEYPGTPNPVRISETVEDEWL